MEDQTKDRVVIKQIDDDSFYSQNYQTDSKKEEQNNELIKEAIHKS